MKLRELKKYKVTLKMRGKYPAAYITKASKKKVFNRHHRKEVS